MEFICSSIMRSQLLDKDFELLLKAGSLFFVVEDGFITGEDQRLGLYSIKKKALATKFQDFMDCLTFLDKSIVEFRRNVNMQWGTSERLLKMIETHYGRALSHGALLLALDLRGTKIFPIEDRKDAYLNFSVRSTFIE